MILLENAVIGNLTMFTVLSLVLVQQDFRSVRLFNNELHSELSNKIVQLASNSLKPISSVEMGDSKIKEKMFKGLVLNVLIANNINEVDHVNEALGNINQDDGTIILVHPINDDNDLMKLNYERWLRFAIKVMMITKSNVFSITKLRTDRISLDPFNVNSILHFIENHFSTNFLEKINLKIFFQFNAPMSCVGPVGNNYIFTGPDGSLAESLAEWMNAAPTFCTDIGIIYSEYEGWRNDSVAGQRYHYQFFYPKVMTNNVVTNFNTSLTDEIDLQMSSFPLVEEQQEKELLQTESIYPHAKNCLAVMVPKQISFDHFLQNVIKNADIKSICIAFLAFAVIRIIIEKSSWRQWISIFIRSLGIFFNQEKVRNENGIEAAWDINLRGFSLLATVALSVIFYENIVKITNLEIDTIEHLIASNLTIFAPKFLEEDQVFLSNIKPILRKRIRFRNIESINKDIVMRRKFNYGYIYIDTAAEYTEMLMHLYAPFGEDFKRRNRIMKERLHCELKSYRISKISPFKGYVNDFVRRFVENGLYDIHLEWIRRLNRDIFQVNKHTSTSTNAPIILSLDIIFGVFLLYLFGISLAIIVFILEISLKYFKDSRDQPPINY